MTAKTTAKGMRAALYLRVSTDDQTTDNQRRDLEGLAKLRGWNIIEAYEDAGISGAKGREQRPGLSALLADAKKRRFDIALFWSVDRLGRSTMEVTRNMEELDRCGVAQFYFKESMDTATPHGRAMLEMAAVFATLERAMIRERVVSGIARVRATGRTKSGRPIGRPTVDPKVAAKVVAMRKAGKSVREVAKATGLSVGAVAKYGS
ncbi:MAG: recombinase family protein [Proteobacteria bacterium]|nr:recombinase family protein [Pseudomonadota bacterium]